MRRNGKKNGKLATQKKSLYKCQEGPEVNLELEGNKSTLRNRIYIKVEQATFLLRHNIWILICTHWLKVLLAT